MRGIISSLTTALPMLGLIGLIWHALVQPTPARLGLNTGSTTAIPGLEISGTRTVGWEPGSGRGRKQWEVAAHRIRLSSDQRLTSFIGVTRGTFFRAGRPQAHLTAGAAVYDRFADSLQVQGNVELRLPEQDARLSTARLSWQGKSRMVEVPESVTLTTPEYRLHAERARVDLRQAAVRVEGVAGEWQGVRLAADRCDYENQARTLKLVPLRLRSDDWTFDATSARIDPRTGAFRAENVHMTSSMPTLTLAHRGRRTGARLASAGLLAGLLASGGPGDAAEAPQKSAEPKTRPVAYEADYVQHGKKPDGRQVTLLTGNVQFSHTDPKDPARKMVLTAQRVESTEFPDGRAVAVATGNPKVTDERSSVVGEKITVHLSQRRAVVEGKVKIVTRPKKSSPSQGAEPARVASAGASIPGGGSRPRSLRERVKGDVVITADRAEYNYRRKNALAEGNVVVTNNGSRITLSKVLYDDRTETMELSGPEITWQDSKGQTIKRVGAAKVFLKEGQEAIETVGDGRVSGTLLIKEDEDEEEAEKPEAKPATGAGTAPAPAAPAKAPGG